MATSKPYPWEQLPNESSPAYSAFVIYRDLGQDRTLTKVSQALAERKGGKGRKVGEKGAKKVPLKPSGRIRAWATKFRWQERAAAYEHHLEAAKMDVRVQAVQSKELERARQLEQQEVETLVSAQQLKLKAFQMLRWPMEETVEEERTTSADGKTIIITKTVKPAGWRIRDAGFFLKTARELEDLVFVNYRMSGTPTSVPEDAPERTDRSGAENKLYGWTHGMRDRMTEWHNMEKTGPPEEPDETDS